jgi:hypothetical protein
MPKLRNSVSASLRNISCSIMPFYADFKSAKILYKFLNLKFKMYRFFEAQYFVFQDDLSILFLSFFLFEKTRKKKDAAANRFTELRLK